MSGPVRRARRRRLRRRLDRSLIAIPAAYLVGAVVLGAIAPRIDDSRDAPLRLDTDMDTARDILTSTATGMIAFTGLVIASVLVVVQFAAGQYSPRLILWFRRDRLVKHAMGSFLAAFLYALVALRAFERRDEQYAPDLTVTLALVLLIGASVLFLALLQRTMDRLRPRALYAAVSREAVVAIHAVYPRPLGAAGGRAGADDDRSWVVAAPRPVHWSGAPGVVSSFDRELLVQAAAAAGVTIELAVAVGEFVDPGQELVCIHGDGTLDVRLLHAGIEVGEERTIEQDPAFAMRIVVDLAIRALSPAVNDPTTAVQGIDVLEPIVRELAGRDLDASFARSDDGRVRLVWPASDWEDVLDLAFDEIRAYGASSVQICRRMRAALEDLRATSAPSRHTAIDAQLARLDAVVAAVHGDGTPEAALARAADRTGIGHRRAPLAS
ncbi:MAG TPA: DUF2254 domain-containing protein [Conexibacter sp.]|nr:DUF2254 domain-containing protein [Conexibacter sp.]